MECFIILFVIIFGLWAFTGFATPGMIDEDDYVDHLHIFRGYHKHKEIKAELEAQRKANETRQVLEKEKNNTETRLLNEIAALRKEIEDLKQSR
jgi:hypothetical protein